MTMRSAILLIPLLMLIDYFLTVVGARLAERGYRQHFKFPDYELNPVFQKNIAAKRWFSPRHLFGVVVMAAFCIFWYQLWQDDDPFFAILLGALLAVFTTVVGGHLANTWSFYFMSRHRDQVSGEVTMSQRYVLHMTRSRVLLPLLPLAVSAYFVQAAFLEGAVAGVSALMVVLSIWMWRDGRKKRRLAEQKPVAAEETSK